MRSTQRDGVPDSVVGRAFALLSAFGQGDRTLSFAELSRRTGIGKATAHRLLHQMAEWNVVEVSADGVRIGMGLFELGLLASRPFDLREAATPFLADLYRATGETVHLAVAEGLDVVYVQKLEGRNGPSMSSRVGGRMPAYCTGVGKALLAHAPDERVHAVLRQDLPRRTPRTVVARGLLERELGRVRETGIAVEYEESMMGISCVASPITAGGGHVVAAVSITGRANRIDIPRLAPAVRTTALGISRSLDDRFDRNDRALIWPRDRWR
ncbi:IclR family transcriptional regulator [Pseudonocardia alni]|uniref:IclR family transcriptional regulator n=1 Tax=Pseudonocardia alni TaxID=33907 RepID=UPI00280AC069|nr:IclR family transcriptional regulator [Pseudonocardia alni]